VLRNRQLTHRPVRTQDFPDFWVLGGLRANRKQPLQDAALPRIECLDLVLSRPLLCLDQSGHEDVEVGWVDVADGDDA
jgi:hypothetical protein